MWNVAIYKDGHDESYDSLSYAPYYHYCAHYEEILSCEKWRGLRRRYFYDKVFVEACKTKLSMHKCENTVASACMTCKLT